MASGIDKGSFGGIALAVGGILIGLTLEGGRIAQLMQPTAALIVLGGTVGAVLLQYPLPTVLTAFASLRKVFFEHTEDPVAVVTEMVGYAQKARKEGIVSLDAQLENIREPFLKKSLMEMELDNRAEREEHVAKVFESAGGFSPTIGIIGAVLGLIQVMQHLDNIGEVGRGIAVAFVATIYGVGIANLFLLPAAGKIKLRQRDEQLRREIVLEGVISILEGMNPRMLETKLLSFIEESHKKTRDTEKAIA
jgi:chemotaxis protein MotA